MKHADKEVCINICSYSLHPEQTTTAFSKIKIKATACNILVDGQYWIHVKIELYILLTGQAHASIIENVALWGNNQIISWW